MAPALPAQFVFLFQPRWFGACCRLLSSPKTFKNKWKSLLFKNNLKKLKPVLFGRLHKSASPLSDAARLLPSPGPSPLVEVSRGRHNVQLPQVFRHPPGQLQQGVSQVEHTMSNSLTGVFHHLPTCRRVTRVVMYARKRIPFPTLPLPQPGGGSERGFGGGLGGFPGGPPARPPEKLGGIGVNPSIKVRWTLFVAPSARSWTAPYAAFNHAGTSQRACSKKKPRSSEHSCAKSAAIPSIPIQLVELANGADR